MYIEVVSHSQVCATENTAATVLQENKVSTKTIQSMVNYFKSLFIRPAKDGVHEDNGFIQTIPCKSHEIEGENEKSFAIRCHHLSV